MADFRTKLITLAGVATLFAGMANAQVTAPCTVANANAVFVASEGTTEQLADVTLSCTTGATGATLNLSVYLSPSVTITSATIGSGGSAKSEAEAGIGAPGGTLSGAINGSVSGSSVTFNGIALPATATTLVTITNIKINATQIATSGGAPTAVTETIFTGGTNVTPSVVNGGNVAFATNGLAGIKTSPLTGNSIPAIAICTGGTAYAPVGGAVSGFNVVFGEGFSTAFKNQGAAIPAQALGVGTPSGGVNNTANTTLGSEFTNNTYTGYGYQNGVGGPTNQATSGTRVQIVFNNVPANVTVYVPLILTNSGATMTLTSSATGAYSAVTGSTANGAPGTETSGSNPGNGTYAAVTLSNGSGTVVYEETTNIVGAQETYTVPVLLSAGAASVAAPSSAITTTVSFAPIGASSNVPNFVSGSSTATVNGNAFSACSTTLLFPFVTNQLGFDTGLAISNTSSDLLNGGTKSNAANQSGTCALTFFGNTAPAAAVVTPSVTAGTTYAAAASTLAPGFQGYAIANCNFLYGHGFAYVVYNLTQNNGAAMGYLADVINNDRKSTVTAESAVANNNPEQ
jgi:hypothetical protein